MSVNLFVHVDASEIGVGAFLAQPSKNDDSMSDLDIIAYFSQRFKHGQRHYSASMKECCGVVFTLAHWRPYSFGKHFTVITDQALTHLYYMQDTSNMLTRWAIALQNFDFTVKHIAGKLNVVPDALSRLFVEVKKKRYRKNQPLHLSAETFRAIDRIVHLGLATSKYLHKTSKT